MTATYNATDNTLTELPDLDPPPDKPIENNYWGNRAAFYRDMINWQRVMDDYNANALKITAVCRTIPCSPECRGLFENGKVYEEGKDYEVREEPCGIHGVLARHDEPCNNCKLIAFPLPVKSEAPFAWTDALMSNKIWNVITHHETPAFGEGDYDEYYEVVNERGDAIQTTDNFDNLHIIADALNSFDGKLRITTALEINLHCDNQMLKAENDHLKVENSKMRKALEKSLEWIADVKQKDIPLDDKKGMALYHIKWLATEALKTT